MSRSVRKNPILKYGGDTRESWKECKKMINRYNRRKSKEAIRNNEDIPFKEKKLCFWDWDFCKWYYDAEKLANCPYAIRKKSNNH